MTDHELHELIGRYSLRRGEDPSAPAGFQYFAIYAEVVGCVAQGATPEDAVAELDAIILPFLRSMVAAGATLPVPLAERNLTRRVTFGPVFVGEPNEFTSESRLGTTETELGVRSVIEQRELVGV